MPRDPLRVVEEIPGVVETGPPQEFDEVMIIADEPDDLPLMVTLRAPEGKVRTLAGFHM
ncbi:hypothetical protein ABZT43_45310 [Streptomyces sp. NPDC005349]|uniref:hypothetical protein n=1 Tax=Streptomyces sp. NPDC005349 TaxID=3157037 RepID=UPI0033A5E128